MKIDSDLFDNDTFKLNEEPTSSWQPMNVVIEVVACNTDGPKNIPFDMINDFELSPEMVGCYFINKKEK